MIKQLPMLILLVLVNGFILLKIPAMTATIFSGHTGGHDAGTGMVASMATRALMG
jgi:competence protein ComGC